MKMLAMLCTATLLASCGLGETATTAAVAGKGKAMELEQARATQRRVVDELDKAAQQAEQRLKDADAR